MLRAETEWSMSYMPPVLITPGILLVDELTVGRGRMKLGSITDMSAWLAAGVVSYGA